MNISDFGLKVESLTRAELDWAFRSGRPSATFDDWQMRRIDMKGKPTEAKLAICQQFQTDYSDCAPDTPAGKMVRIVIINYLNALKRGGQLDMEGNVVR